MCVIIDEEFIKLSFIVTFCPSAPIFIKNCTLLRVLGVVTGIVTGYALMCARACIMNTEVQG